MPSSAHQRAAGHAQAQRRLVQQDGRRAAAGRRADDDRERGGDEQGVAQTPAGPEADQPADRAGGAGQRREDHDESEAEQQGKCNAHLIRAAGAPPPVPTGRVIVLDAARNG
ncbi:hypothetical protein GCM10018787_11630 [Streptomyces thermodiastaticus]|nr:hypothetical protein GCM10018787_11630 [Streptomyces thermodiastaticus]